MPRVRFKATSRISKYRHAKGPVVVEAKHGDKSTTKIRSDGHLRDQDIFEATDFQADWAVTMYPDNFEVLGEGEGGPDPDHVNPDDYLKDDLLELAEERGVPVTSDMTKPEIADALNQAGDA